MMKSFCYAVRDALNGSKIIGGMLHAESLDDAAGKAIRMSGLKLETTGEEPYLRHEWLRSGRKVYLSVSIHADHYLDAKEPTRT
jgi:hypothetical protein